jgi:uncharacterized protein YdeI (YjbR/CyaY-like superfamily)
MPSRVKQAPTSTRAREPTFFATPADFRRWLTKHHRSATELRVGFYKRGTGRPSMTWPESVDEALCFGWIDGVRNAIDAVSYMIRFTPRKATSTWSLVNVKRVAELVRQGRMQAAGQRAYDARNPEKSGIYSFEQRVAARLTPEAEQRFRANQAAWIFFEAQPPGYRKTATFWVVSARQEATRDRRLEILINDSAAGRRIAPLRR